MSEYNKVVAENKDEIKAIIEKEKQLKMEIAITRVEDADTQHEVHKQEEISKKLIENTVKAFVVTPLYHNPLEMCEILVINILR